MPDLTVISYYTQDWRYPEYAQKLREDCQRLGLKYHIIEKPSTNSYVGNCQLKAFFIRDMLMQLKQPIFWMDADGSILKYPELLIHEEILNHDMAGNHPENAPHRVHVGSIWFNYTPKTMEFVNTWCGGIERKHGLDDAAFNGTWDYMKNDIKFLALPKEYFFIHKDMRLPANKDAVILHRLSSSDLKISYKTAHK